MKKFTPIEETNETIAILGQKPEIDRKITFYKEVMMALGNTINAIKTRLEVGYTLSKMNFLGFTITKKEFLDDYDKSKLIIEKQRVELDIFEKKNYYDRWMERKKQYDEKFSKLEAECNANYDSMYQLATKVMEKNLRLADVMGRYKNEENDIRVKVEFYLYIKQEVENAIKYGSLKVDSVKQVESEKAIA